MGDRTLVPPLATGSQERIRIPRLRVLLFTSTGHNMETQAIQQAIDAIEQATDKAVEQLKKGQADAALQSAVQDLHQQTRTKRTLTGPKALSQAAMDIEQAADKAMEACRAA